MRSVALTQQPNGDNVSFADPPVTGYRLPESRSIPIEAATSPAEAIPASGVLARLQYPLLATALVLLLILGWRGREPVNISTTDENTYVALSKSLQAGSYREIYLGSAPLHVKYPPGYPAFVLAVRLVGGENLDVIRAANLLLLATSILFMFLIVRRVAGVGVALAVAFLLAINHSLLNVGGSLLSESLFVCLGAAALWCTMKADDDTRRHGYWAIALALAGFLTRTAGVTLVAAIGVWLLRRRRRAELVAFAVGALLVVGGWFAYTSMVPHQSGGASYGSDIVDGLTRRSEGNPASPLLRPVNSLLKKLGH
jgi:4-amino-4-deoxy-L-arabinose transferase-like glycosyltransferase